MSFFSVETFKHYVFGSGVADTAAVESDDDESQLTDNAHPGPGEKIMSFGANDYSQVRVLDPTDGRNDGKGFFRIDHARRNRFGLVDPNQESPEPAPPTTTKEVEVETVPFFRPRPIRKRKKRSKAFPNVSFQLPRNPRVDDDRICLGIPWPYVRSYNYLDPLEPCQVAAPENRIPWRPFDTGHQKVDEELYESDSVSSDDVPPIRILFRKEDDPEPSEQYEMFKEKKRDERRKARARRTKQSEFLPMANWRWFHVINSLSYKHALSPFTERDFYTHEQLRALQKQREREQKPKKRVVYRVTRFVQYKRQRLDDDSGYLKDWFSDVLKYTGEYLTKIVFGIQND